MPEGDKGEDNEEVKDAASFGGDSTTTTTSTAAARWDVEVADDPAVKGAVPGTPECEGGVIIRDAAGHVLGWIDAVYQGPETEEAPRDQEFEPDDVEVEVGHHAELGGGVEGPVWEGFRDGHDVDVVED